MSADDQLINDSVNSFYDDYVVVSADQAVSRGFLDGIQHLIRFAGESSNVAQAARVVALGGVANRLGRLDLLNRSRSMYGTLLGSFQTALLGPRTRNTMESLMTATLLGIYEVISDVDAQGQHAAHIEGVAALLNSESSVFKCNATAHKIQFHNSLHINGTLSDIQCSSIICKPDSNPAVLNLDHIFNAFSFSFHRANALLKDSSYVCMDELRKLRDNVVLLDKECCKWVADQTGEWMPMTIGSITVEQVCASKATNCWPGPVNTYFDLYVASIWNTYRKIHLMVLDIIFKCSERLGAACLQSKLDAQRIAEAIAASVPFHLMEDAQEYVNNVQTGSEVASPGRPVGGLLMLYPLHVAAECTAVSQELRHFMKDQLRWIGKVMGIGQASLLSNPSNHLSWDYIAEGHLLVWAGMLIRPT
ncbi:hypothetical protein V495_05760 [Pseudogymnoascus sp. VKM F-4514 (FW-929)]|nr:hypothetical protein V495_05760 [Pseudogymnoascus sp. VKM F-4514 (FW-929)]KFY58046.1 hypothetical protein V497_05097 [Pseudogymnoascus sp. VKM F-4516 (FW-969)]